MALSKRIREFRVTVNSNNYDLPVSSMSSRDRLENYADAVTSVGGTRYIRPAGVRKEITIEYEKSFDKSEWRNLINDIITHIVTNGNQFFDFYFDATATTASDKIEVQPQSLEYLIRYENQIGRLVPSLSLVQRDRQTSIASDFEAP